LAEDPYFSLVSVDQDLVRLALFGVKLVHWIVPKKNSSRFHSHCWYWAKRILYVLLLEQWSVMDQVKKQSWDFESGCGCSIGLRRGCDEGGALEVGKRGGKGLI
jgi:hypothetical protein